MSHYRFEWNPEKALANERKHGVSFDEAKTIFEDLFANESFDVAHSSGEDRLIIIGMSARDRLLIVAFTLRDHETIRIISARRALPRERRSYEEESLS